MNIQTDMKPKQSTRINLLLLFIIICILFFLHFRRLQREIYQKYNKNADTEVVR